jgi:hypothetical protein
MGFSLPTCQSGAGTVDCYTSIVNFGKGWNELSGVPFIHATTVNGQPDYGDQTNAAENPTVIDGYNYEEEGCTD